MKDPLEVLNAFAADVIKTKSAAVAAANSIPQKFNEVERSTMTSYSSSETQKFGSEADSIAPSSAAQLAFGNGKDLDLYLTPAGAGGIGVTIAICWRNGVYVGMFPIAEIPPCPAPNVADTAGVLILGD